jgi:monoamine oxidase
MAGLSAATKLKAAGLTVIVLEARSRIGGRVWTDRSVMGYACDMGAGWIHGPEGGNPITPIAQQANATTALTPDTSVQIFDASGRDVSDTQGTTWDPIYRNMVSNISARGAASATDISVEEAVRQINSSYLTNPYMIYPLSAYSEFDSGGPIDQLSARNWQAGSKFPGKDVLFPSGYDAVTNQIGIGLDVRFGQKVTSINTAGARVQVSTATGASMSADYVVCTLPLGVLKQGSVTFTPALPSDMQTAINRTRVGYVNKVFCDFESAFWPTDVQYFGAHTAEKGMLNYWLSYRKFSSINCLVGLAVGNAGQTLESLSNAEITSRVTTQLRTMFGSATPSPRKINVSRWTQDALAGGSYAFPTVGGSTDDAGTMGQTIAGRLYFAGEHTSTSYVGTVHGAILEGRRAAESIMAGAGLSATAFTPQSGWWWNAAEGGRGFFIEIRNGQFFLSGYLYANDGSPTWFVVSGSPSGNTLTGPIKVYSGGQALGAPFRAATEGTSLGTVTVQFQTATTATMTWPGGTVSLARYPFGNGAAPTVESGWWWNPNEGGRGFSMEFQGSSVFAAAFTYVPTGAPIWYVASGTLTDANTFSGQWVQYGGGQTMTGAHKSPTVTNANAGSLQMSFSGPRAGVLTLPNGLTTNIVRFL